MTRKKRLRRVAILCCHCLRNLAFYEAGWKGRCLILKEQFWVNVNGNFLDICVLEWCKLFADLRGEHCWKKIITNSETFFHDMLNELQITEDQFNAYILEVRTYRDKFVAHLDSEEIMYIPMLKVINETTIYLYNYLIEHEDKGDVFLDAPNEALAFYNRFLREGQNIYDKLHSKCRT